MTTSENKDINKEYINNMKRLFFILAACCVAFAIGSQIKTILAFAGTPSTQIPKNEDVNSRVDLIQEPFKTPKTVYAGDYLASRFAQKQHDWQSANDYINRLVDSGITPDGILQRAMILSMGSGNAEEAMALAHRLKNETQDTPNTVAEVFLIAEAFKKNNYKEATQLFEKLTVDGTANFIRPFVTGWLNAAENKLEITNLKNNTMQLYHAILISDFLSNHSAIEQMIDKALKVEDINSHEQERIADLYGHVGLKDKALKLYETVLRDNPENQVIKEKISSLKNNQTKPLFEKVESAQQGLAKAFHDISGTLYNEQNDESARVFGYLALYLEPDMVNTKLLLAEINSSHKQYDRSIALYKSVPKSDKDYLQAQYKIAEIYEETGRVEQALGLLQNLSENYKDAETLIKIGNLYRHHEKYKEALEAYDQAIKKFGGEIPADFWHLHYVRGISYEQLDNWAAAEKELKAALEHQPDHPYILNYLGYAWADRGENLEEALHMIQRAVELRPDDGFITDSLGWVFYRTQNYDNAVIYLERAVELLPADPTINDHLGDSYWKVGRTLEAQFQWRRAQNHSDDPEQIKEIEEKLLSGLEDTQHQ